MKNYFFIFLVIIFILTACKKEDKEPYVVVLSVDGFRWDYPDSVPTPNLDRIAKKGVKARALRSSFPTKTFPNHYSMATGLYPDHHGIVLNSFYDEDMDAYYSLSDRDAVENPEFYGGEPIWVTAEKQGVTTASYFWVGSEAPIKGIHPTYWKRYDHDFPYDNRIDSVMAWLQLPEDIRPHLIMWYIDEPDGVGHDFGPFGDITRSTIIYLDSLIGVFTDKLQALPVADEVNFIVTSDHGMCETSDERVVILSEYIDPDWFEIIQGYSPNFNLKVNKAFLDTAFNIMSQIPNIKVWKHGEVPEYLHYGHNPRTMDLILLADSGWIAEWEPKDSYSRGAHGYDNNNTDMDAIFYAMGPAFKENFIHPGFDNIDLYPLFAHLLRIHPVSVDGKLENTIDMLQE